MDGSLRFGRLLFAIAMVFFGFEFFLYVAGMSGPLPGPPWSRGALFLDWLACAGFIFAGVSIATGKIARLVATFLGVVLLLYVVGRYMQVWLSRLHDPGPWTVVFEILAMVGGAWVLAAGFPADKRISYPKGSFVFQLANAGRFLIAISLVVFAVQHFMYAQFVASLIPAWIPGRLFWAYFTGIAFIAAAISIATRRMLRTAGMLLGTMFSLWVILLHVPRVARAPHNGDEVTSLFVALAMSGVGFALASASGNRPEGYRV
jgi:uncharacterized membrane protein